MFLHNSPKTYRRSRLRSERALTLVEVMVALGVMVILVSGLFMVVQISLSTVLLISNNASREDELTNLTDILRNGFRNLAGRARLTAQPVSINGNEAYLMTFRDAPGFLTWRSEAESEHTIVLLAVMKSSKGLWKLCMRRLDAPRDTAPENLDPKTMLRASAPQPWLTLVDDFKRFSVRFFDGKLQKWSADWQNPQERPALAEFNLVTELAKDAQSETAVLWIPPVKTQGER